MKKLMMIALVSLMCGSVFAGGGAGDELPDETTKRYCTITTSRARLDLPRTLVVEISNETKATSYATLHWSDASEIKPINLSFRSVDEDNKYIFENLRKKIVAEVTILESMSSLKLTLDNIEYEANCTKQ